MGSRLLYGLIIWPISRLPYPLLYAFSDFAFFMLYHVVGYRKKVVRANLRGAFPEWDDTRVKTIERRFYRHFADVVVEALKNFSVREKEVQARMIHENPEIINAFAQQDRSTVLCGGHQNNWELWGVSAGLAFDAHVLAIYKRLSNAFFDQKMRDSRGQFGLNLVATRDVSMEMKRLEQTPTCTVYGFDQSPANPQKAYWLNFLGRETACFYGPEKFAREHNSPVIFGHVYKVKRGHYRVRYEVLFERPAETEYGEITRAINRTLERDIRENPEYWLWTHRRWKHQRPEGVPLDERD